MRTLTIIMVLLTAAGVVTAGPISISYLSADHVYVNAGKVAGLHEGQQLKVMRGTGQLALLEIVFLSDHSASCLRVSGDEPLRIGDLIQPIEDVASAAIDTAAELTPPASTEVPIQETQSYRPATPAPDVWGQVAIGLFGWRDRSVASRDFTQTNVRLNLRTQHLLNDHVTMTIRSRGRYDERNRTYRPGADSRVWLNRMYEFSLAYQSHDELWRTTAGRFPLRAASSLGMLDGLLIERTVSDRWTLSAFGGMRPDWQYSDRSVSLSRFGAISEYRDRFHTVWWYATLGLLREYHSGELNRDAVILQARANNRDRWSATALGEFDINSGWRKERSGKSLALSVLHLYTRLKLSSSVSLHANYSSRQTVWHWEVRDLADTLVDDRVRHWFRLGTDLRLSSTLTVGQTVSAYYATLDESPSTALSGYLRLASLWHERAAVGGYATVSDGDNQQSTFASVRFDQGIRRVDLISLAAGINVYKVAQLDSRSTWWLEGGVQHEVMRSLDLRVRYRYTDGDDIQGDQFETELGYRF